jgi:hypothetical protein
MRKTSPVPPAQHGEPSTVHGNPERGIDIVKNGLYVGKLLLNRLRFIKDPETGKRVSRSNPESEWIPQSLPELQIIEGDLWKAVKTRRGALRSTRMRYLDTENLGKNGNQIQRPFLSPACVRAVVIGPSRPTFGRHYRTNIWSLMLSLILTYTGSPKWIEKLATGQPCYWSQR